MRAATLAVVCKQYTARLDMLHEHAYFCDCDGVVSELAHIDQIASRAQSKFEAPAGRTAPEHYPHRNVQTTNVA